MVNQGSTGAKLAIGVAALPLIAMSSVLMVTAAGGANASPTSSICGGGGTAQTIGNVNLDAEQLGNARKIVSVAAGRHLPAFAAVVAVATSYTEVKLRNQLTQTDHDSEGLFQQRISIYSRPVADDPVKATNAFLDRLLKVPNWQNNTVGVNAQTVQISEYPDRYQPNAPLARQIVGQYWPAAAAAAGPAPTGAGGTGPATPAICAGGGGAIPGGGTVAGKIVGPTGDNVAGTTTIPAGFVISGSATGRLAVRYALAQLGKPYLFGAAGLNAFDCSGLTMAAWAAAGVPLPHLAAGQASSGTAGPTNLSQAVGGDLVLIPGSDGTAANPGHVGMVAGYVDKPDGRHVYLIQAPMAGVPVELTEATQWSGQITDVRHIS